MSQLGKSDHYSVLIIIPNKQAKYEKEKTMKNIKEWMKKTSIVCLRSKNIDRSNSWAMDICQDLYRYFESTISELIKMYFPMKMVKLHSKR